MTGRQLHTAGVPERSSAEQALILRAVRHLIVGGPLPLEIPGQTDLDALSRLVSHSNSGALMLWALSPKSIPFELQAPWQCLRMHSLRENMRALRTVSKLLAGLESAGVPVATMRGLPLAHSLYPDPSLRPMHDVDLLIRPEDAARCEAVLETLGHRPAERLRSQYVYHIEGTTIEVHWSVLTAKRYRQAIRPADLLAARQQRSLPGGTVLPVLSPEHELICLACHALVHHEMERLLFVADLGLLASQANMDWQYVQEFCRQARLTRLVGLTLAVVNRSLDLGCDRVVQLFEVSGTKAAGFSGAYLAHLFGQNSLRHYLARRRALFYVAETPTRWLRQALRLFSWKEIRTLWAQLAGNPRPSGTEDGT